MKTIIFIRGLPGTGKSTLAKKLSSKFKTKHFEADQYMVNDEGEYDFNPSRLFEVHRSCLNDGMKHLKKNDTVIFSNTFVTTKDFKSYVNYIEKHHPDANIEIHEPAYKGTSIHGVPKETLDRMQKSFLSKQDLISYLKSELPEATVEYK